MGRDPRHICKHPGRGGDPDHPFVLVPMDHSALLASFGGDPSDERAKSFIDKTFDLTFRVPPPVRSDWKAFLRSQMEAVFGARAIEDRTMYFIEKVFDSKHVTANEFPTPRVINRFVNSVATTWLARRKDNFPLAIVSLFATNLDELEESVLEFTQRDDLTYFDSDFPGWRDQIVALYFGVPAAKSRQVLLEGPLRQAIEDSNTNGFRKLFKYPGAFKVFDDVLRRYAYDSVDANSQDFTFKSAAMLETVQGHGESVKRSWEYLLDRAIESIPAPDLAEFDRKLSPFLRRLSNRQLSKLIPVAVKWLSYHASTIDDEDSIRSIARSYRQIIQKSKAAPKILLRGEPLAVINAIYWIVYNEELQETTTVEQEFSKLVPDLAKLVSDKDQAVAVPEVLIFHQRFPSAFPSEKTYTLAPLRDASITAMETDGASPLTGYAAQNLGILARLTSQSEEAVDAVIDAGHLQARLDDAISSDEAEVIGVLAALAIFRGKPFNADTGQIDDRDRFDAMEMALDKFTPNALNAIWNAQAAGHSPAFLTHALQHVVRNRQLSKTELDQISTDLEFYFKPLGKMARNTLARKVGEDPGRVERIGKLSPSSILVDILAPLVRLGVPDADRQCKATIENLPTDSWKSYLEGNGDWIFALLEKCPRDFKLTVNSHAVDAAVGLIASRSAALNSAERAKLRRLVSHFNVHAERKLIEGIIAQGATHARNTLALFKTLDDETTASISSYLPADRFVALLHGLSLISDGRIWLEAHTDALQKAISRFDRSSKKLVREWFITTKMQKPIVRANWVEMMGHRLGLDR